MGLPTGHPSFFLRILFLALGWQYRSATGSPTTWTFSGGMLYLRARLRAVSVGTRMRSARLSYQSAWVVTISVTTLINGGRSLPRARRANEFAKGWTVTIKSAGWLATSDRAAWRAIGHMVVVMTRARARPSVAWKLALHK